MLTTMLFTLSSCSDGEGECRDGSRTFGENDRWTCADGCNICQCYEGEVVGTLVACSEPNSEAVGKRVCFGKDGRAIHHGQTAQCEECECTCNDGRATCL